MNCDSRAQHIRERVVADQAALSRGKGHNPLVDAHSRRASAHLSSQQLIAGPICYNRLVYRKFEIDECELLAGRIKQPILPTDELQAAQEFLAAIPDPGGQTGHCEVATAELFALGINGLLAKIANRRESAETTDQAEAYESFMDALRGLSAMIEHAALPAEAALKTAGPERRAELDAIIASCRRIAHQPPETFLDALHLVWFVPLAIQVGDSVGLVCSGHIDRRLIAYYTADLAAGRISRERALELIEGLYFLTNDFCAGGLAFSVMVGGRDATGRDVTSVTSWDHTPMIGGSAFNMKFPRALFHEPVGVAKLKHLILTFLRQGGFETQINVVDNAILRNALANPEAYGDLVVRIGGYTDYFTRLSPEMQQEVMQRTQYGEI